MRLCLRSLGFPAYQKNNLGPYVRRGYLESSTSSLQKHVDQVHATLGLKEATKTTICAITGAGISTASGIPDYRSPDGSYSRGHKPEFMGAEHVRKRYWARNMRGWPWMRAAKPNDGHVALDELQRGGFISCVVTQNVDRLHHKAGSRNVCELHGNTYEVVCVNCSSVGSRDHMQHRLVSSNEEWIKHFQAEWGNLAKTEVRADGDLEPKGKEDYSSFMVPSCEKCGGILKPHTVMFGENIPEHTKQVAKRQVEKASGVLLVGTSVSVLSVKRLVDQALDERKPVVIVNKGPTQADQQCTLKIEADTTKTMRALRRSLES